MDQIHDWSAIASPYLHERRRFFYLIIWSVDEQMGL